MLHAVPLETAWNIALPSIIHIRDESNTMGLLSRNMRWLRLSNQTPQSSWLWFESSFKSSPTTFFFPQLVPFSNNTLFPVLSMLQWKYSRSQLFFLSSEIFLFQERVFTAVPCAFLELLTWRFFFWARAHAHTQSSGRATERKKKYSSHHMQT